MIYTITLNPALDREMTVNNITLDQVLRAHEVRVDYGGKGINISRQLLALGIKSTALGFIGGFSGEQLAAGLTRLGLKTDFVRIDGETRVNISVVDEKRTHHIKVNEPGPYVNDDEGRFLFDKVRALVEPGDWWILSGSASPGIAPSFIGEIVSQIKQAGALAVIDMEAEYLQSGCASGVDLVKPNAHEASELTHKAIESIEDAQEAMHIIHEMGANQVIISMGKSGAIYSNGDQSWHAKPPRIKEKNPVGAGDALLAGFIWAICNHMGPGEALRFGVACGTTAASLEGTAVGDLVQVQELLPLVVVKEMSKK